METSEKVPIFAWIEREGGLPAPLHNPPCKSNSLKSGFVYTLSPGGEIRRGFSYADYKLKTHHNEILSPILPEGGK